jgi:hypothetical protein
MSPSNSWASTRAKETFFNRINELRGAARCGAMRRPDVKVFDIGLTRNNWILTPIPPKTVDFLYIDPWD